MLGSGLCPLPSVIVASVTGHTSQKTHFPWARRSSASWPQLPFKISVLRSPSLTPNRLKQQAFQQHPSGKRDPSRSFKYPRKVRPRQYIQRVTIPRPPFKASSNCKTLQFLSILSDPYRAADPLCGAVWAYGFAVIHFCKKFYWCGAQAGAEERGFRDADAAVGVAAACSEAVSVPRLHV